MTNTNLRLPDSLHESIKAAAEVNHRSMNDEMLTAVEYYLKHATPPTTRDDIVRREERKDVRNVFRYFKREFNKNNPNADLDIVFDGLLREIEANWNLSDKARSRQKS